MGSSGIVAIHQGRLRCHIWLAAAGHDVAVEGRADPVGGMWAAVTTIVVMAVALQRPGDAWEQPLLRLFDTVVGVAIGVGGKWIASFAFYKARGEPIQ